MNPQKKQITKIFLIFFVFGYILINWSSASWIFNYKEVNGLVYDFFNPYQESDISANINNADSNTAIKYNRDNSLLIPKIGLRTPIILSESTDEKVLVKDLDRGAVYYPGSVLPGKNGQILILGHSAPPNWPRIKHDWIFSKIENLNAGDKIMLAFNNTEYVYFVKDTKIIEQGQDISSIELSKTKNVLTLISCWPPGKNYQRIAVTAELTI